MCFFMKFFWVFRCPWNSSKFCNFCWILRDFFEWFTPRSSEFQWCGTVALWHYENKPNHGIECSTEIILENFWQRHWKLIDPKEISISWHDTLLYMFYSTIKKPTNQRAINPRLMARIHDALERINFQESHNLQTKTIVESVFTSEFL